MWSGRIRLINRLDKYVLLNSLDLPDVRHYRPYLLPTACTSVGVQAQFRQPARPVILCAPDDANAVTRPQRMQMARVRRFDVLVGRTNEMETI